MQSGCIQGQRWIQPIWNAGFAKKLTEPASYLEPFRKWLIRDNIVELAINPDDRVWIEIAGDAMMRSADMRVESRRACDLAQSIVGDTKAPSLRKTHWCRVRSTMRVVPCGCRLRSIRGFDYHSSLCNPDGERLQAGVPVWPGCVPAVERFPTQPNTVSLLSKRAANSQSSANALPQASLRMRPDRRSSLVSCVVPRH